VTQGFFAMFDCRSFLQCWDQRDQSATLYLLSKEQNEKCLRINSVGRTIRWTTMSAGS